MRRAACCSTSPSSRAPGDGRTAVDLGCGAGVEVRALLDAGWVVHALDADAVSLDALRRDVDQEGRLTTRVVDLDRLEPLPPADLVYSGYALPFTRRDRFAETWRTVVDAVRPGGWLAVNLFGDRDSWAPTHGGTFLGDDEVDELLTGLEVVHHEVEEYDGAAFSGPKHWHVHNVVARRP